VKVCQTSGVNTQIRFIEGLVFFVVVVFVFHNRYTRIDLAFYNISIKSLGLVIRKATNHRVEFRKPINANPGLKKKSQKISLKNYETEIKILANPGLA